MNMREKFEALRVLGAGDFEHLNGSLISHLKGTESILAEWGADAVLRDAGLFHAAYGTAGFEGRMVSLEQRSEIARVIGAEAEKLVYLYCSCDRDFVFSLIGQSEKFVFKDRFENKEFMLSHQQAKQFCELTVANELELVYTSEDFKKQYGTELLGLFQAMEKFLSVQATEAYREALA